MNNLRDVHAFLLHQEKKIELTQETNSRKNQNVRAIRRSPTAQFYALSNGNAMPSRWARSSSQRPDGWGRKSTFPEFIQADLVSYGLFQGFLLW